jgi:hypothetical protein
VNKSLFGVHPIKISKKERKRKRELFFPPLGTDKKKKHLLWRERKNTS